MQKSEFPKMRHYVGFSQIGSHMYMHAQRNTHFVITLVSLKDRSIAELPTYVKNTIHKLLSTKT